MNSHLSLFEPILKPQPRHFLEIEPIGVSNRALLASEIAAIFRSRVAIRTLAD